MFWKKRIKNTGLYINMIGTWIDPVYMLILGVFKIFVQRKNNDEILILIPEKFYVEMFENGISIKFR